MCYGNYFLFLGLWLYKTFLTLLSTIDLFLNGSFIRIKSSIVSLIFFFTCEVISFHILVLGSQDFLKSLYELKLFLSDSQIVQ